MLVDLSEDTPGTVRIGKILQSATSTGIQPEVARNLVGAGLSIRFPHMSIESTPMAGGDGGCGNQYSYQIGSTVFLVADDLSSDEIASYSQIRDSDFKFYVLAPAQELDRVRSLIDNSDLSGRTAVTSIEDFTGQVLDQIGGYRGEGQQVAFEAMLSQYNHRVRLEDSNPELRIEATFNLG